jgi:hypothetical protein
MKKIQWLTGFISGVFLLFSACDNNSGSLGFDVIPPSDELFVKFCDTISFKTSTFYPDSVRSDEDVFNTSKSYSLLGQFQDPEFGLTRASFATQIMLAKSNVDFGTGYVIDSIVLQLNIAGRYGFPEAFHQIDVFKLKDSINIDSVYYSNLDPALLYNESDQIGTSQFSFSVNDSLFRIPLKKSKLTELTDTSNLVNATSFQKAFYGLFLKTSEKSSNSILYINLLSSYSKLTVYYKNYTDTLSLDFPVNSSSARINLFEHNYLNPQKTVFADQLEDENVSLPDMYIQGATGVRGKLRIPNLKGWPDSTSTRKIAITKAELILKVNPRPLINSGDLSTNPFGIPGSLQLAWVNTSGELKLIPDQVISQTYFSGVYNYVDRAYHFKITTMIQNLIDDEITDFDYFCLFPSDSRVTGNSVVLHGGEGENKARLEFSYIEL